MKKLLHILFIYIGITISIAQQYPVRLIPSIFQPYSLKLGDYATSTEPKLQLLMTDLMEPQHQTGLKFSLESGLNAVPLAVSNDFVVGFSPFTLYPGSQLTLSNIDVRALFELQNLSGINSVQYAQALPDGVYQFCFQAYDYYTKNNLSQKSCATVYLVQYDPPQLNLPQNGEKLQAITPYSGGSGIVFQWMPRQIAPNTKYIFTLKELWDLGQSPISGFLSSRVLWQEESYAPTLFYGLDKPQLMPGKRYAWQVQAKSGNPVLGANPTEDNGVYKNNGLTEIFYFDYVEDCTLPTLLMAKNAGRGRIELSWNLSGKPSGLYQVQYRRKGSNTQWQTVQSYQPRYIITGLEDQTEYEYRVGNACGQLATAGNNDNPIADIHSAGNTYAYSGIQYFTTDSKDKTNQNYQCGVMPAVDITNKTPLQSLLGANEVFMAGDFPVTVLEAQGSNGIYSGTGYIVVPYLADTKVKVSFNNIKLNTDRKLIEGVIETTYDPNETAVAYASAGVGELFGDQGVKDITIDYEISDIKYVATPPPGKLVIEGNAGAGNNNDTGSGTSSQQELPVGKDYTIIDKNGNVWAVDEEGNVTKGGEVAKGGASTPENTSGVDSKGSATAITAKGIRVIFKNSPRSQYAFDEPTKALTSDYKELNGKLIPFKAVENKKEEPFIASVELTDSSISADSLIFKTSKGVKIASKKIGNDYELTLKGLYSYATEEVQAVIKQGDKYNIAGVFNLVHISPKEIKLNLIPTTGVRITEPQQQEIKNIYKKIGIDVSIKVTPPFDISPYLVDGKLPTEDVFGDLSKYSPAQNAIISAYKSKNEVGLEYYLFVTDKPSSNGQNGYMRLNGQFGFVYDQKARTIAHELAHGALRLEHPFSVFKNVGQGEVKNLMDYDTENTNFIYPDWKQINDPAFKLYTFQGQNEGEFNGGYVVSPDYKIFTIGSENTIIDKTDYSTNGALSNDGTLPGFKLNGIKYWWSNGKYVSSDTDTSGYSVIDMSNSLSTIKDGWMFLFYDKEKPCGEGTYVTVKISDFINSRKTLKDFISFYANASFGTISDKVELGKKEIVGCIEEGNRWKKEDNKYGNGTNLRSIEDLYDRQGGNGQGVDESKDIVDYTERFTADEIKTMLSNILSTEKSTGIKGKIFITDENTTKILRDKVIARYNNPKQKELVIWLEVNSKTRKFEVHLNNGSGLPEYARESIKNIEQILKQKPEWINDDKFWTVNFNPLTAILDGVAELIGKAEIHERFYNPDEQNYNPFPAKIYSYINLNVINNELDILLTQANGKYTTSRKDFAFVCGVWNGLVETVVGIPEGGSFLIKMITNEKNARTEFAEAISKISWKHVKDMASEEWNKYTANPCMVSYGSGKVTMFVASCFIGVGEIKGAAAVIQTIDKLDVMGQLLNKTMKIAGTILKPVANVSGKAIKYVLKEGVTFIKRVDIKVTPSGLGCGFPIQDIKVKLREKLSSLTPSEIDDITNKVNRAINDEGGLAKLPKDENGNRLVEIDIDGEKVPVLVGENSSLDKIAVSISKLDDIAAKLGLNDADKALFKNTFKATPTLENAQSWKLLKESIEDPNAANALFRKADAVEALTKARLNPNIKKMGITDKALAEIRGFKGASFEDVIKQLDEFATHINPAQVEGLSKLVSDLGKGGSWSQGAEWTLRYISKNSTHFNGRKIMFEVTEKWGDMENKMIRIADVVDKTNPKKIIYYELKSVIDVPPGKFAEQFIKDLSRGDVTSLDQLKWIFDGKKLNNLPQKDFVKTLESSKDNLFNGKARKLFEEELGETFLDADDLIQALYKNESWFKKIFQKIN
ncbi:fibronectin type III domain-containing protein [Bergeyella zoohelcum]|nr:fibronectin type III domain-containing protein [Bergeyella zoohelcum]SUV48359.1 Fibronectin type III domain [Bergeyella zoohelcum]